MQIEPGIHMLTVKWDQAYEEDDFILGEYAIHITSHELGAQTTTTLVKEYGRLPKEEYFKLKLCGDDALREYTYPIIEREKWK